VCFPWPAERFCRTGSSPSAAYKDPMRLGSG
jgi:hypothetical protein